MTPPMTTEEKRRRAIECAMSRRSCGGCDWQHYCEETRRDQMQHRRAEEDRRSPPASLTPEDDRSHLDALYKAY